MVTGALRAGVYDYHTVVRGDRPRNLIFAYKNQNNETSRLGDSAGAKTHSQSAIWEVQGLLGTSLWNETANGKGEQSSRSLNVTDMSLVCLYSGSDEKPVTSS